LPEKKQLLLILFYFFFFFVRCFASTHSTPLSSHNKNIPKPIESWKIHQTLTIPNPKKKKSTNTKKKKKMTKTMFHNPHSPVSATKNSNSKPYPDAFHRS